MGTIVVIGDLGKVNINSQSALLLRVLEAAPKESALDKTVAPPRS